MKEPKPADNNSERPAFTHPLKLAGYGNYRLREFDIPEGKNYIIRKSQVDVRNDPRIGTDKQDEIYIELEAKGREQAQLVQKFIDAGINLPPTYFVTGDDEAGVPWLFQLTEKVDGKDLLSLSEKGELKIEMADEINKLIINLLEYIKQNYDSRAVFPDDVFRLDQYVYGKTAKDVEPKLYLIDTDPHISPYPEYEDKIVYVLHDIKAMINTLISGIGYDEVGDLLVAYHNLVRNMSEGIRKRAG
jgi:hypothetical protein